jgi:hypothetical protein
MVSFLLTSHQIPTRISPLPLRAVYPAHIIFLDLIFLIIYGEQYKLLSSSLCNFLQPPELVFNFPLVMIMWQKELELTFQIKFLWHL